MVLERPNRRNEHRCRGLESAGSALEVQELLGAQIGAKPGFSNYPVGVAQGHARCNQRVGSLRDVGKGSAVQNRRVALERLHQVGFDGVAHQNRHGIGGL